jgi:exopolysaccharide production protein ExoQ
LRRPRAAFTPTGFFPYLAGSLRRACGHPGATMPSMPVTDQTGAPARAALLSLLGFLTLGAAIGAVGPVAWAQRLGMLPVLSVAAAGMLFAYRPRPGEILRHAVFAILALGCVWILVTLAWTPRILPDRVGAAIATLLLCGLAVAVARPLPAPHDRRLRGVFLVSIAFLVAALIVEALTQGAGSALIRGVDSVGRAVWPRGSAVLVVTVWIALAILIDKRWYALAAVLAIGAAVAIWGGTMRSAQLASVVALVAFAAAAAAPRATVVGVSGLFAVYGLAAPWISLHLLTADAGFRLISTLPLSAYHRLAIWEHAAGRIADHPLAGLGFGAARWISDQHHKMVISAEPRARLDVMPLHTHNNWIQVWLETGLVGLVLALAIVALVAVGARRRFERRPPLMAVAGAAAGGLTVASMSFGVWQEWWLSTLALAAVLIVSLFPGQSRA